MKKIFQSLLIICCLLSFCNLALASNYNRFKNLKVCAVTELYFPLENINKQLSGALNTFYGSDYELYYTILNNHKKCDVLLSHDEKLYTRLTRMKRLIEGSLTPFIKSNLVLWSNKPFDLSKRQNILAVADPKKTVVGFETYRLLENDINYKNLANKKITLDQQYKAYNLVASNNADLTIIAKPLIYDSKGNTVGYSKEIIPQKYMPITYFASISYYTKNNYKVTDFITYLQTNSEAISILLKFGYSK